LKLHNFILRIVSEKCFKASKTLSGIET